MPLRKYEDPEISYGVSTSWTIIPANSGRDAIVVPEIATSSNKVPGSGSGRATGLAIVGTKAIVAIVHNISRNLLCATVPKTTGTVINQKQRQPITDSKVWPNSVTWLPPRKYSAYSIIDNRLAIN